MSIEEAILERVRRLPVAKQEQVLRFADGLEHRSTLRVAPARDRSREIEWIEANRAAYVDQWVAVEGDELIAAGSDALQVFEAAKERGVTVPFVVHLIHDDSPFVAGW